MMNRERADKLLVAKGFFESRTSARAAIEAGGVIANGAEVTKANQMLPLDAEITAEAAHPYVSRGGLKLAHALDLWPDIKVKGAHCLDIGASTGGFTDVLLQRGAARVLAVDVGTGQLHAKLTSDQRVTSMEQTDVRSLLPEQISHVTLIVCDASFIALEKLLGPIIAHVTAADVVLLFKPQFQVGRANIGKNGLVQDIQATAEAISRFEIWAIDQGLKICGWTDSPITGGDGNAEALCWLRRRL